MLGDNAGPPGAGAGNEDPTKTVEDERFSLEETIQIGRLINGLSVFGCQLIKLNSLEFRRKAVALLQSVRQQHEVLLKRLDRLARSSGEESALRLIEDLNTPPGDVARELLVARRCLAACAFLGHCVAILGPRPTLQAQADRAGQSLH